MTMRRRTPYVAVNLTVPARDALRQATVGLTSAAGRKLSMSDLLLAALHVARGHEDELIRSLTGEDTPGSPAVRDGRTG